MKSLIPFSMPLPPSPMPVWNFSKEAPIIPGACKNILSASQGPIKPFFEDDLSPITI
jgi:hypothetical protein